MLMKYILENGKAVPCPNLFEWGAWFNDVENRIVERTTVAGLDVSTVFLGLDHNYSDIGPPILFETMVFGDDSIVESLFECTDPMKRYCSTGEAKKGHFECVYYIEKNINWIYTQRFFNTRKRKKYITIL